MVVSCDQGHTKTTNDFLEGNRVIMNSVRTLCQISMRVRTPMPIYYFLVDYRVILRHIRTDSILT